MSAGSDPFPYIFFSSVALVALLLLLYYFPFALWIKARAAGVPVGFLSIVRLRIMGVSPSPIVNSLIVATKAGIRVSMDQMTAQYMAGGHVEAVIVRLIQAKRAQILLNWPEAAAIDLGAPDPYVAQFGPIA